MYLKLVTILDHSRLVGVRELVQHLNGLLRYLLASLQFLFLLFHCLRVIRGLLALRLLLLRCLLGLLLLLF